MVKAVHVISSLGALLLTTGVATLRAETAGPFQCDYVKADSLIKCVVLENAVPVTDATVNDGKCRSPLQVFETNKLMMKRNFGVDMDAVASFVRSYDKGDTFSLNVDKGCAVYTFSVKSKDRQFQFRVLE